MNQQVEHISEEDLERYAAFRETLSEDKLHFIEQHLLSCALCTEQFKDIKEFYRELSDRLDREPLDEDKRLAEALSSRISGKLLPFRGLQKVDRSIVDAVFETVPVRPPLISRGLGYVKRHPIAFGGTALGIAVILLIIGIVNYNAHPVIYSVTPQTLVGQNWYDTLYIAGNGFQEGLTVKLRDLSDQRTYKKAPLFVNGKSIVLALRVGTDPSEWTVQIANPNGKMSNEVHLKVIAPSPQTPWLIPSKATAGGPALDIIITGITYTSHSVVRWNGQDRPTKPIIDRGGMVMGLRVTIPASDIAVPGVAEVTVFNPPPGGGLSSTTTFEILPKGTKSKTTGS